MKNSIRPLPGGRFLVFMSLDKKAWVVSGYDCATRVPLKNARDKKQAIAVALKQPRSKWWLYQ